MKVDIRFEVGFLSKDGKKTKWRTVGGTVNMPCMPRVGEIIAFDNGIFNNGNVHTVVHGPSFEKPNVFVPYVYLPNQLAHMDEAAFEKALKEPARVGEIKLTLLD